MARWFKQDLNSSLSSVATKPLKGITDGGGY